MSTRTFAYAFTLVSILGLALSGGPGPATAAASDPPPDPEFGSVWHDGKAELDGYHWTGLRYGEQRRGQAVMVFVTEPMSKSKRVKVDDPGKNPSDVVDVLKLNLVRDLQTGIYDYNTMTSVFVRTEDFAPLKVSFSSAEWCGHVYDEMWVNPDAIHETYFSYFEGESGDADLPGKPDGILEDALYIQLRGLRGDFPPRGGKKTVPFLPGEFYRRLLHSPTGWTTATIERLSKTSKVTVPAGTFEVMTYTIQLENLRQGRFDVEAAYPHRIVRWSWRMWTDPGAPTEGVEQGELSGTARLEYWKLHGEGDESYLKQLGLEPQPRPEPSEQ